MGSPHLKTVNVRDYLSAIYGSPQGKRQPEAGEKFAAFIEIVTDVA